MLAVVRTGQGQRMESVIGHDSGLLPSHSMSRFDRLHMEDGTVPVS